MMKLLHIKPKKKKKEIWVWKNEAGTLELAGNITFRKILFFIRVVSDSYAFNNINP